MANAPRPHGVEALLGETEALRGVLLGHAIYESVNDLSSLRVFMGAHVFAVWDFMTLLKALQRRFTCVELPWLPPTNSLAARLINDIVLAEESDEVAPERVMSHFELYLEAMEEVGCQTRTIRAFTAAIRDGAGANRTLRDFDVPAHVGRFVRATLTTAFHGSDAEIAASFLLGREDLVPHMFRRLLAQMRTERATPAFSLYLNRHIEVDESQHGPAARALLNAICRDDPQRWSEAATAAKDAILQRIALWDGVQQSLP
jgi:hypothetical protein